MARTRASINAPRWDYVLHPGPYRVAAGDLADSGMPGQVFAPIPRPGFPTAGVPAIAFGHGWLQPVRRYADTLRYFASWGLVAVAPATERGPLPSHQGLAADLNTALHLVSRSTLGRGEVTVDPQKLGLAGHSLGGGVAVLAAAQEDSPARAVATVNAAETRPSALPAAGRLMIPALHLVGAKDVTTPGEENGELIARAWAGPAQLRSLKKAAHLSVAEGSHWTDALVGDADDSKVQHLVRALMTAFFLQHLAGQEQLADDLAGKIAGTTLIDLDDSAA